MALCRVLFCLAVGVVALNIQQGDVDAASTRSQTIVCAAAQSVAPASQLRQSFGNFLHHELRFGADFDLPTLATAKFNPGYPPVPPNDHLRQSWSKGQWGWD